MAYTKTTWNTGDVITAEKLNHMEDGIASGGVLLVNVTPTSETEGTADKSYSEILEALQNGQIPVMFNEINGNINLYLKFNFLRPSEIYFGYSFPNKASMSIEYVYAMMEEEEPNTVYFMHENMNLNS